MSEQFPQCREHGESIARLEEANKFRDQTLNEIKEDVKAIKIYLEQQKGAVRVISVVAGVVGSIITLIVQSFVSVFKPHI